MKQSNQRELDKLNSSPFEPLIDANQAAILLRIHPNTLRSWARQGRIPSLKLGRKVSFRASILDVWLTQQLQSQTTVRAAQPERTAA